jgi:PPE-repeat protein
VQLVFSNLFGQNAPAIAATESDYEAMWAQDVAAMIGYHGGVSAAAAQLSSWTKALPGLSGGLPAALSSLNPAAGGPVGGALGLIGRIPGAAQRLAIDVINAPSSLLLGRNLIPAGPQPTGGSATISGSTATTPVTMRYGTEPIVDASVGSGSPQPLLVDTGSKGLVIPFTDVGGLVGLLQLGIPRSFGMGGYGFGTGGVDFFYLTYDAKVNFGGGLVTSPTPVNVELFSFPTSLQTLQQNGLTFQSFEASDGAAGTLGIGPNATGPGHSIPLTALPAPFNQGVLINENSGSGGYLQFGANPFAPIAQLNGFPNTTLDVRVNGGPLQAVSSTVDSGGVEGSLPANLGVKPGDTVVVYAGNVPLYQFTDQVNYFPITVSSGQPMNTGNFIFSAYPIYISYSPNGVGTAFID